MTGVGYRQIGSLNAPASQLMDSVDSPRPVYLRLAFLVSAATTHLVGMRPMRRPAYIDSFLTDWLRELCSVLDEMSTMDLSDGGPDWNSLENLHFIFRACARNLANLATPRSSISERLNEFANQRPFVFRTCQSPHFWHTTNLLSSRVMELADQPYALPKTGRFQALVVKPDEGLIACWILQNILGSKLCRLDIAGALPIGTYERILFDINLGLAASQGDVADIRVLPGSSRDAFAFLSRSQLYDVIYLEGFRNLNEQQTPFDALELMLMSWRHLRIGGYLTIDDQILCDDPFFAALSSNAFAIAANAFLSALTGPFTTHRSGRHLTIGKGR